MVHARNVFFCRLLYDSTFLRIDIFGQNLDRYDFNWNWTLFLIENSKIKSVREKKIVNEVDVFIYRIEIFESLEINDGAGYFTIFKYFKNVQFHKISAARINFHFCLVNRSWNYSFGMYNFFFLFFFTKYLPKI